ncbi:phage tail spike protein [Priestia megaterium]|uniref:phage tail spike protein n=1 Tax=Priestia megaterium TaxID=1404 RepID=UPI0031FC4864
MENSINNMIIVTDQYGRQLTILANHLPKTPKFFDDGYFEQLDGLLTYEFSTLASDPDTQHLIAGNNVIVRNKDRKLMLFTIIRTVEERKDNKYVRRVFAENAAVDDLYNHIVDGEELVAVSVKDAATKVLAGTGWQLGIVDYAGLQNVNLHEYPTALAALHQIRDQFGLEMEFTVSFVGTRVRDRFVHLVKRRGNVTGKRFTYGKDLTGVTREVDRSDIATAVIPIGKADETGKRLTIEAFENVHDGYVSPKGQKWVGDEHAMQLYGKNGKHLFKRLDLSSVDNEYELMKKAVEELKRVKQPRATYEVSVLLLESLTGYEHEKVRLGDTILVKDTMFEPALAINARVISIYRSYTNPSKDYVVLGEFVPLVIDKNRQIEVIQETINQNITKWEQGGEVVYKSATEPLPSKRTPDMLWLDTSKQPNIMKRWDAEKKLWVNASVTKPEEIGAETPKDAQDKANKAEETAIAEAAEDAAIKAKKAEEKAIEVAEEMDEEIKVELKSYVEGLTEEVEVEVKKHADQKAKDAELNAKLFVEGYAEKEWHYGETPPEDLTQVWFDMSSKPNKIRKYNPNTKTWEAASPTKPSDIGAETPTETLKKAQDEAKKAKDAAIKKAEEMDRAMKTEAERIAKEAEGSAKKHTDEVTKQVEEALKQDAQNKADAAKQGALNEADNRILKARQEAEKNAKSEAERLAKEAEDNASKNITNKIAELSVSTRNLLLGTKGASITATNNVGNTTNRSFTFRDYPNAKLDVQGKKLILSLVATGKVEEWGKTNPWIGMELSVYYTDGDKEWLPVRFDAAGNNFGTKLELGKQYNREVVTRVITIKDKPIQDLMCQTLIRDMAKGTMKLEEFKIGIGSMYTGYDVPLEEIDEELAGLKRYTDTKSKEAQDAATKRANDVKTEVENFAKNAGNITQGTLAAERLHGVTISGKSAKIVDIDAANITTGLLDAARIKAQSIGADHLAANAVTVEKLAANSINASKLQANSVTVDKIAANSVTADKVAANAITTDKLHVLAKNLINNFTVTNSLEGWSLGGNTAEMILANDPYGRVVKSVSKGKNPNTFDSARFKVEANKTYKVSLSMWMNDNPQGGRQYFGCHIFDKDNNNIGGDMWDENQRKFGARNTNPYFWNDTESPKGWRHMEAYILGCDVQNPAEVPRGKNTPYYFRMPSQADNITIRFYNGYYPTDESKSSFVLWHSPTITEVDSGAIVAENIIAGTLDANKVNVTNLNAANITSGTMTADRINGGTINAANTNIINLKAGNITSGTIDASKIAVINLDASKITTGMLNVGGTQIAIGTDFMHRNWRPLRNSIAYSTYENYLILGGAQTKEEFLYLPRFDLNGGGSEKVTLAYEYNVDSNHVARPEIFLLASKTHTGALLDSVNHDYVHVLSGAENPVDIGGGWFRVTKTFTLQGDIKSAVLRLDHNGSKDGKNCNYRYRRVMLNYGSVALTWSPHTTEAIGIGSITGDQVRANAITTDKLTVGDFTNLVPNSSFMYGTLAEWDRGTVVKGNEAGVPAGAPTEFVRTQTERDTYVGDWFPVKEGDRFYCEMTAATSNSGVPISLGLHYVDKDNKPYWTVFTPRISPTGGKWVTQGGEIGITIANATKAKVFMQVDGTTGSTFGTWYVTNAKIHRKTDSNLLVNGSVIADKIAANQINANHIIAGAITTDHLAAAGISADKITSGVIDANRVQVRNLNAGNITGGTMSADRITGGTINANNTNIINLKAQNITSGTINADNVEISNGRVAINKDGVTVTDANFLVRDAKTGLLHTMLPSTNLLYDHSFETISADGSAIGEIYYNMEWATLSGDLNSSFYGWARVGTPKMIDALVYDAPTEAAPFGLRAGLFNQSNYVAQRFGATAGKQYTISFHAGKPYGGLAAGAPRLIIEHMKDESVVASETKDFPVPNANVGEVVRYGVTITANAGIAGGRTSSIRVRFLTTNGNWCVFDGVQAVSGNRAAPYDAEDSLWKFGQYRIKLDAVNVRKLYGDTIEGKVVRSANFQVPYKNSRAVVDHSNGNVSFNAASGNVHLGNMNTNEIIADKVVRVQNGMSIRGVNENGVGIETSKLYRSWGGDIELNNAIIKTPAVVFGGNIPTTQDGTLWYGNGWQGLGFYVAIGGAWHTVSAGFGAG